MAEDKNDPTAPAKPKRDPAKHAKKDPARPTRAKAAREHLPPLAPALEKLLNPGIEKGTAGPGSQTGLTMRTDFTSPQRGEVAPKARVRGTGTTSTTPSPGPSDRPVPKGERLEDGSQTGLKPPPDNSFDRRADFSAAHRARASTSGGFSEAPQKGYVGKTPLGPLDPDLARVWGIEEED